MMYSKEELHARRKDIGERPVRNKRQSKTVVDKRKVMRDHKYKVFAIVMEHKSYPFGETPILVTGVVDGKIYQSLSEAKEVFKELADTKTKEFLERTKKSNPDSVNYSVRSKCAHWNEDDKRNFISVFIKEYTFVKFNKHAKENGDTTPIQDRV